MDGPPMVHQWSEGWQWSCLINKYFELKKLVERRGAPELELLASNLHMNVQ